MSKNSKEIQPFDFDYADNLLQNGAKIMAADDCGQTALHEVSDSL